MPLRRRRWPVIRSDNDIIVAETVKLVNRGGMLRFQIPPRGVGDSSDPFYEQLD